MTQFRQIGDTRRYNFRDKDCIGLKCWAPGLYQHRACSGTSAGTRNTGAYSATCMSNAYRGCPDSTTFDAQLALARKKEGWRPC